MCLLSSQQRGGREGGKKEWRRVVVATRVPWREDLTILLFYFIDI